MSEKIWRIAGIDFDHMHMGDLLGMAKNHPRVQIVGVSDDDPARAKGVLDAVGLDRALFEPDYRKLLETARPDLVILCPATGRHADWVERIAPFGTHILVEKPFAATLAEADRMIAAVAKTGKTLTINWPMRWVPAHVTAKRLIVEGTIGELIQIRFYGGNRGPLRHLAGKVVVPEDIANSQKAKSWWYQQAAGGGSMLDYLGYGTTLGTWFMNDRCPVEMTAMVDMPEGLEVDEQSIAICRYDLPNSGLSKLETRWGTFTDPWITQPQPRTGFVLIGRAGTISSYDYSKTIRIQTRQNEVGADVPVDELKAPFNNPINYVIDCLETGREIDGPLSPRTARIGQKIVDAARQAGEKIGQDKRLSARRISHSRSPLSVQSASRRAICRVRLGGRGSRILHLYYASAKAGPTKLFPLPRNRERVSNVVIAWQKKPTTTCPPAETILFPRRCFLTNRLGRESIIR